MFHRVLAMRDGHLEASSHNWVEAQGSGLRIDKKDGEKSDTYNAKGNKIDKAKQKRLRSAEKAVRCYVNMLLKFLYWNM